jgi:hypothetical protein
MAMGVKLHEGFSKDGPHNRPQRAQADFYPAQQIARDREGAGRCKDQARIE